LWERACSRLVPALLLGAILSWSPSFASDAPASYKFDFGAADVATPEGWTKITPETAFSSERGFGLEPGAEAVARTRDAAVPLTGDFLTATKPFLFSVVVPEGTWRVAITFGDLKGASENTIKAESRRLMLEGFVTARGKTATVPIAVNVRTPALPPPEKNAPGGTAVLLNDREQGVLHWDDKLTLEFNGSRMAVCAVEITPADDLPVIYLVGDSTVTDQPREPGASWGQMLPRFLTADVAVANHAESGETMKSFISGLRLAKVLQRMKAGDFLLIQFGHNDSKKQWPQTWAEANTTYKAYLKVLIAEARLRGATPVLVTSMQRRNFDANGRITNSHGDYPDAVRAVAAEEKVALIDLEVASRALYEALGPDVSPRAFAGEGRDRTHHNNYGAYELAKCVVQGIRDANVPLAKFIVADFVGFDPAKPDPVDTFNLPPSPGPAMAQPPRGN
jgi:lysophospholipase L1-like esterase